MSDDPIVYLATAPNEPLARMWADVLEEVGIRTLVKVAGPGVGAWGSAFSLEHELHVLRSRHAEASALLRDVQAED